MNGHNSLTEMIDQLEILAGKLLALFAVIIGAVIKIGEDLANNRPLTPYQRFGVYMITIGFGFLGYFLAVWCQVQGAAIVLVVSPMTYGGEHILKWVVVNREKILDWITFRNWGNKK